MFTRWLLGFIACNQAPTLSESIDLIQVVQNTPEKAETICPTLPNMDLQNQCWKGVPQPDTYPEQVALCQKLQGTDRDECLFRVAEQHNKVELCTATGDFEWDCRTHIFQQTCGQYHDVQSLLNHAQRLNLDSEHSGVADLLHRCALRNKRTVDIRKCAQLPYPKRCRSTAKEIFSRNLNQRHSCQTRSVETFGDEELADILREHLQSHCQD